MPLAMTLAAALPRAGAADTLEALGWRHAAWPGIPTADWRPLPGGGVAVQGDGQGSFVWRRVHGAAACLRWRWRVEEGPPPTDLTRRGSDRALSVAIGFNGWPPGTTAWQRTQHGVAQAIAGDHPLPRSILIYAWGGTGREPAPFFTSPYASGLGRIRVLRTAEAPRGRWVEEQVDLAADWRAAFGGDPPPLQEIAIGTDVDDSRSRVRAAVEGLSLGPCR